MVFTFLLVEDDRTESFAERPLTEDSDTSAAQIEARYHQ